MRADLFLVEHGHATTRSQAQRLIASGVRWRADPDGPWKRVAKNGDEIPPGADIDVPDTTEAKYISRGGLKLEGALQAAGLSVAGLRCLDVGQSTGGFTDCLLQHGAAQVVGIDVGQGQLHASMRSDPRVVCIEGVNARSLTADELVAHHRRVTLGESGEDGADGDDFEDSGFDDDVDDGNHDDHEIAGDADAGSDGEGASGPSFDPVFDVLTGDLSFISLTLVLPAVVRLLKPQGQLLMLVKPQFELQPGQVGKGGIVREPELFAFVEQRVRDCVQALGCSVLGYFESPIQGGDGNREFFIHARKGDGGGDDAPLPQAPARKTKPRVPRSELRAHWAPHPDSELAQGGPGPARRKRRDDAADHD